ncbi:hypothetical protein ACJIZ3_007383 [Penstemon smallii]|uniref:Uncharacterized protein n=1 Tax=Penstemon smallii TaxID=265156 RepID=A0ABD3SAN1_9LAMI
MDEVEPQFHHEEEDPEIIEPDVELDESHVVEPDNDPPQKMGDPTVEVTEENRDAAQEAKIQDMEAISERKLEEAIEHLTKAILLNPTSAIMYASRGESHCYFLLQLLIKDLHLASKLDYDEEISAVLKKPNAHKMEEHRRKYERLRKEREDRKLERKRQRCRGEARAAAYEKSKKQTIFKDTPRWYVNDISSSFKAPIHLMESPANLGKHQANPKVAPIIAKMLGKFGGPK